MVIDLASFYKGALSDKIQKLKTAVKSRLAVCFSYCSKHGESIKPYIRTLLYISGRAGICLHTVQSVAITGCANSEECTTRLLPTSLLFDRKYRRAKTDFGAAYFAVYLCQTVQSVENDCRLCYNDNMETIKFIFFDIGYTLVNEDKVWFERCREQAATQQAQSMGITAKDLLYDIQTASNCLQPQWKYVIEKYGFLRSAKYKSELESLYPDACFVLESLSKNFSLGVIANQSGDLSKRLRDFGIDKYFSAIISSSDYGYSKPDERLFSAALEKSNCAANNAVMVGDRLDNDILPAKTLGFQTVRIKQGFAKNQIAPSVVYEPTYEINNLTELLELPFVLN